MRKFTYILTVMTLMILCAGCKHQKSVDDLPEALQEFVEETDSQLANTPWGTIKYKSLDVEDQNIICNFDFDESEEGATEGRSIKQHFQELNLDEDLLTEEFAYFFAETCSKEGLFALREYEYNLIVRFTGTNSLQVVECTIPYTTWRTREEYEELNGNPVLESDQLPKELQTVIAYFSNGLEEVLEGCNAEYIQAQMADKDIFFRILIKEEEMGELMATIMTDILVYMTDMPEEVQTALEVTREMEYNLVFRYENESGESIDCAIPYMQP